VLLDHPAYFLRGGPKERLQVFIRCLRMAGRVFKGGDWDVVALMKKQKYTAILDGKGAVLAAKEIVRAAKRGERVSWDVEDDVVEGRHLMLSVAASVKAGVSWVFLLDHPRVEMSNADRSAVKAVVKKLLQHSHSKIMQHGAYDCRIIRELLGVEVVGFDFDTEFGSYFVDTLARKYGLKAVVSRMIPEFTGWKRIIEPEVSVEEGYHLAKLPLDKLVLYTGADVDLTKRVEVKVRNKVPASLVKVYAQASQVFDGMEQAGPWCDLHHCERLLNLYEPLRDKALVALQVLADDSEFNPGSHVQVAKLVFEKLGLPRVKGNSVDKHVIAELKLQDKHSGLDPLLKFRSSTKLVERVLAFQRSAGMHKGRLSTIWWLTGTRTGRASSGGGDEGNKKGHTNLQNIPTEPDLRDAVVSDPEWRAKLKDSAKLPFLLVADYSQMEMRVLAQVTGDPALIEALCAGRDVHAEVGALWSGWPYEVIASSSPQCDEKKRKVVKGFHFGTVYGLVGAGLWRYLREQGVHVSVDRVEEMQAAYFCRFPRIRSWMLEMPRVAQRQGYVENLFGFRVPIEVSNTKGETGAWWGNQALNSPIQGAAHQVLLCAMALIARKQRPEYACIHPQLEAHDGLLNWVAPGELLDVVPVLQRLLEVDVAAMITKEFGIRWVIPFICDVKVGVRLGSMLSFVPQLDKLQKDVARLVVEHDARLPSLDA